jgi:hypothetical protein
MDLYWLTSLIVCASLLLASLILLAIRETQHQRAMKALSEVHSRTVDRLTTISAETTAKMLEPVLEGQRLVAAADPLAFQQISAMASGYSEATAPYDPSDEAEMERLTQARNNDSEGDPDGDTRRLAAELGIDPDFLS